MFGFLILNPATAAKPDVKLYRSYYCGLCDSLETKYGLTGRRLLTYDLTFLNLVLASATGSLQESASVHCPLHLISRQTIISTPYNEYCAEMNLYMAYFKLLDDWDDDNDQGADKKAAKLEDHVKDIEKKYPELTDRIKASLKAIRSHELANELNPDIMSNLFGEMMAEIFAYPANEISGLSEFGFHLGRFIYLMDAVVDLKEDLIKQRYNPLTALDSSEFKEMLLMVMEQADAAYRQLNIKENQSIIENVLYSGIWTQYEIAKKKGKVR